MTEKYVCDSQQRILKTIDALVGHEVDGISAKDVAAQTGANGATAFRDLQNLQLAGWAEQLEDGGWRISVNAAKMLRRVNDGINRALSRVNSARRDYQDV